jgi:hypothetical protein
MTTANVGFDTEGGHDVAYERILAECQRWREDCKPIFLPEDSSDLGNWPVPVETVSIWMEEARQIAVSGYRQVLEAGSDVCDSESDSENSDHGENWSYADRCTLDMFGPDRKPKTGGPQQLSAAKVLASRAAALRTTSQQESGRTGGGQSCSLTCATWSRPSYTSPR